MDRSAALLERAKNVQEKNREIEEIIAGLQSVSLQPLPPPRPPQSLPYWIAPALAAAFGFGLLLGAVAMAWVPLP
jgi:hypothetical protein